MERLLGVADISYRSASQVAEPATIPTSVQNRRPSCTVPLTIGSVLPELWSQDPKWQSKIVPFIYHSFQQLPTFWDGGKVLKWIQFIKSADDSSYHTLFKIPGQSLYSRVSLSKQKYIVDESQPNRSPH